MFMAVALAAENSKFDLRSELFCVLIALIYGSRILKIMYKATPPTAVAFAAAAKAAAPSAAPMLSCCCRCTAATAAAATAATTTAAAACSLPVNLAGNTKLPSMLRKSSGRLASHFYMVAGNSKIDL